MKSKVMASAQPPNIQRLIVVIVVRINPNCPALLTRLSDEASILDGDLYSIVRPMNLWVHGLPPPLPHFVVREIALHLRGIQPRLMSSLALTRTKLSVATLHFIWSGSELKVTPATLNDHRTLLRHEPPLRIIACPSTPPTM